MNTFEVESQKPVVTKPPSTKTPLAPLQPSPPPPPPYTSQSSVNVRVKSATRVELRNGHDWTTDCPPSRAAQATDCFTFFWHVHLQSHLTTLSLAHTHGTHSVSKSTFKSRLVSSSASSFHWSWLDLTVLPVSQYICSVLVVQRFRQLILLDRTYSWGENNRTLLKKLI